MEVEPSYPMIRLEQLSKSYDEGRVFADLEDDQPACRAV